MTTTVVLIGCAQNSSLNNITVDKTLKSTALCGPASSYDNPLNDVGEIVDIHPPSTGPYPYFKFLEGPVWVDYFDGGSLFFSDLGEPARIWKLTPPSTIPLLYLENSGSNGLALDNNKNLIIADRESRRITQLNLNTKKLTERIPANGVFKPNDVLARSDNSFYFTASKNGFFHVAADGKMSKAVKAVYSPNGIALSLDETKLYVGDFTNKTITSFELNHDGSVNSDSAMLFASTSGDKVDGMTTDCAGNIYVGTTAGVEVFNAAGIAIGILPTGRSSNITFGGLNRKILYVTTPKLLKAIKLSVQGLPN